MKTPLSKIKGNLVYINNGKETVVVYNELFGILQRKKTEFIRMGYDKNKLKLKYIT